MKEQGQETDLIRQFCYFLTSLGKKSIVDSFFNLATWLRHQKNRIEVKKKRGHSDKQPC